MPVLNQDTLKELMIYDPETGELLWRKPRPGIIPGKVAGTYHRFMKAQAIGVFGKVYRRGQLVWLYHNGELPARIVHKDGDRQNDRLENLTIDLDAANAAERLRSLQLGESGD